MIAMRDKQRSTGRSAEARIYTGQSQGLVYKGGYEQPLAGSPPINRQAKVPESSRRRRRRKSSLIKVWMDDEQGTMPKMPYGTSRRPSSRTRIRISCPPPRISCYSGECEDAGKFYGVNGFAHSVRDRPVNQDLIDSMKKGGTISTLAATLSRDKLRCSPMWVRPSSRAIFLNGVSAKVKSCSDESRIRII